MRRVAAAALVLLVVSGCGGRSTGGGADGQGIRGVVLAGPQCPVETAESPCPDQPVPSVRVEILRDGETVGEATTDRDGRFTVTLDPGTYEVRAAPGQQGFMSSKPVGAVVTEGAFTDITVAVDTGIR
jgi:Carboxypeptidase regulatory-like domain